MERECRIVVIGAGHAGIEAALASARMGLDTVLFTINLDAVDAKIKDFAKNWEWERISLVDRNIMRVAVYEMLFDMDVPPIVSINEGVEIARDYADEKSANFINGVLNAVKDSLDRPER